MASPTPVGSARGEHVINNGVRKVYETIENKFLDKFQEKHLLTTENVAGFRELMIRNRPNPLPNHISEAIETLMVYRLRPGDRYNNANANHFGLIKKDLQDAVVNYMLILYQKKMSVDGCFYVEKANREKNSLYKMISVVVNEESYIDREILGLWRNSGVSDEHLKMYEKSRSYVREMLMALTDYKNQVTFWVNELYKAIHHKK